MARPTGHTHHMRIVAHTLNTTSKDRRVLLGCTCAKTEVLKPNQAMKEDTKFAESLRGKLHLCCADKTDRVAA